MRVDDERVEFWRGHFAAWQRSGLSQRVYCERQGLSYAAFGYWRNRVKGAAVLTAPAFVPVRVEPPDRQAVAAVARSGPATPASTTDVQAGRGAGFEIRLAHGRAIVVAGDFDEAQLARVIRVVEQAPC